MIKKIECFVPVCDICGKNVEDGSDFLPHYETESDAVDFATREADGAIIGGLLCCSKCWAFDDNDDLVMVEGATK